MKKKIAAIKTLTWFVITDFLICITFTVVVLVFNHKGIEVSDTLIQYFFTFFGLEFGATAAIKITKSVVKAKERSDLVKDIKDNNLEVEKQDITKTENEYDYSEGEYYG